MKHILVGFFSVASLFANNTFEKDVEYTCVNTHTIQKNVKFNANKEDAKKRPLKVSVVEDKLYTNETEISDFLIYRGDMSSYSNTEVMLLMTKDLELGLVPKKEKGQLQYFFKCKKV